MKGKLIMLKVLIVDDEILVQNHLKHLIDWEASGFTVCGAASNGASAVQMILEHRPSIVLSDISMPLMNGVALSEYVGTHFKDIKMIIISSFDTYDYVRETMNNGVIDYLLKHRIDESSLLRVLLKAKDAILIEAMEKTEKDQATKKWDIVSPLARQNYVRELVLGVKQNSDTIEEFFDVLEFRMGTQRMAVIVMQIMNYAIMTQRLDEKELITFHKSIVDLCEQNTTDGTIAHIHRGRFVILLSFGNQRSEVQIHKLIFQLTVKLKSVLYHYLNIQTVFGHSSPCAKASDVPEAYKFACQNVENQLFIDSFKGDHYRHGKLNPTNMVSVSIRHEKNMLSAIENLNTPAIETVIDEILADVTKKTNNYENIQFIVCEMINIAHKVAHKSGIEPDQLIGLTISREQLQAFEDIRAIKDGLNSLFHKLTAHLREKKYGKYSRYVEQAMEYMHERYKQDISLNDVADFVGIHSSYLSHLFKKETDIGFTEYLNKLRVQAAKDLLDEGYKVKEMFQRAGFNNYNYFFKVFKDIVGITPSAYERRAKSSG
jgi:two-component system response regulator YesN